MARRKPPGGSGGEPRKRGLGVRSFAVIAALLCAGVLLLVGAPLYEGAKRLRSAPQDNMQWTLSQLEVDLLQLLRAVKAADQGKERLEELRRRFETFYSRSQTLARGTAYGGLYDTASGEEAIAEILRYLDRSAPLVDGPDADLAAALPGFARQTEALLEPARTLTLEGITAFSQHSDARRAEFETLLWHASLTALALILLLGVTLLVLMHQRSLYRQQASALARSRSRLAEIIDASLDAIVLTDAAGRISVFNRAAEEIFGIGSETAIGRDLREVVLPPRLRAAERTAPESALRLGAPARQREGRIEMTAMAADRREFPVEVALAEAQDRYGQVLIAYIRDISDRRAAEEAMRTARDKALQADSAKTEFIAVMNHEMRTPLNGILGTLDLLRRTSLTPCQRRYLEAAQHSGEILLGHINDVLDVSSITSGGIAYVEKPLDLACLVRQIAGVNRPLAESRNLSLSLSCDEDRLPLLGDAGRLRQILMNLVDNAIKFTQRGSVAIDLTVLERLELSVELEIAVTDTGVGIAEADLERIFEEFVTLDASYRREGGGSGLGLAISKRLVEGMGGRIGVESVPGCGSRFWVRLALPLAEAGYEDPPVPAAEGSAPRDWAGKRVLLVEDNATNRLVLRDMLAGKGLRIEEAEDGMAGIAMASAKAYDLILMDISMPLVDGVEATRTIRGSGGPSQGAPIVGVTAHALPEERRRFAEAGIGDLLVKPLRLGVLEALLERLWPPAGGPPAEAEEARPASAALPEATWDEEEDEADPKEPEIVDTDVLSALAAQMSEERLAPLLERAIEELEEGLKSIARARRDGTPREIQQVAHKIAGTAGLIGAAELHAVLSELETACKLQDPAAADAALERLESTFAPTRAILREFLEPARPA